MAKEIFLDIYGESWCVEGLCGNKRRFRDFRNRAASLPEVVVTVSKKRSITVPTGGFESKDCVWVQTTEGLLQAYLLEPEGGVYGYLEINQIGNSASLVYDPAVRDAERSKRDSLLFLLLQCRAVLTGGIILHASAVTWQGKGIVFSAPSGTGKTTQAALWKQCYGGETINGDRPVLRFTDGGTLVYGSPWSGSDPEVLNVGLPVPAIIMLAQAPENHIRRLEPQEALPLFLPRCFLPYFDEGLMNMALTNCEKLLAHTPVFLLECRPEMEASQLVMEQLSLLNG